MTPSDQGARDAIVGEAERNVVVDAGAGTGKTETLVRRYVAFLERGVSIRRLAAITFTRRAAGELRFRIRELVLRRLAEHDVPALRDALVHLDEAPIGTIHSFADRLLRLRPVEAKLSPRYEIREETGDLVRLTTERLLRSGEPAVDDYLAAGLPAWSEEKGHQTAYGLDALMDGLIATRDVELGLAPPPDPVLVQTTAASLRAEILQAKPGWPCLQPIAALLEPIAEAIGMPALVRALDNLKRGFPKLLQRDYFKNDKPGWALYGRLKDAVPGLAAPVFRALTFRLASLRPKVLAIYEEIKREREVVDQTDLLIKLRELLRNEGLRAFYAGIFDHFFVDEFQDTDPVQADILQDLVRDCTKPRSGAITIVGDPKQSIYRFRRADIEAYASFREWLAGAGALVRSLTCNFRSVKPLIDFYNARFSEILGNGAVFDPPTGRVGYERLETLNQATEPAVLRIPFSGQEGGSLKADEGRVAEAGTLARVLKSMHAQGRLRWGDVAVLSMTTTSWADYAAAFDRFGIPYAARGGSVFARDVAIRSFLLALRAVADPEDGVALAAYYRPPIWPLTLEDLAHRTEAYAKAEEFLKTLRRERTASTPAATARRLLNDTHSRTMIEAGPNGRQNLAKVEELIHGLDRRSREGLDFDAVSAELRSWIDNPSSVEMPEPVEVDVVRFLTIHQAKGLEFPVVLIADSFQQKHRNSHEPWRVNREGTEVLLSLDGLSAELPEGCALKERDKVLDQAERLRLVYVAATRARDLLILPVPTSDRPGSLLYTPLAVELPKLTADLAVPDVEEAPAWSPIPASADDGRSAWMEGIAAATLPRFAPLGVTSSIESPLMEEEIPPRKSHEGRFGPAFGTVVHRVLALKVSGATGTIKDLVENVAREEDLEANLAEAVADVERAWATLSKLPGARASEFPVAATRPDGHLLQGYIDLLVLDADEVHVIDFKTDAPGDYPTYAEQVGTYVSLLRLSPTFRGRRLRASLLFTATGERRELPGSLWGGEP